MFFVGADEAEAAAGEDLGGGVVVGVGDGGDAVELGQCAREGDHAGGGFGGEALATVGREEHVAEFGGLGVVFVQDEFKIADAGGGVTQVDEVAAKDGVLRGGVQGELETGACLFFGHSTADDEMHHFGAGDHGEVGGEVGEGGAAEGQAGGIQLHVACRAADGADGQNKGIGGGFGVEI